MRQSNTNTIYKFGPFTLEPSEHRICRNGEPMNLKGNRFKLLVLLVENAGHLLRKNEIIQEIWPDVFIEEATMVKMVSRLSKLLDEDRKRESPIYIETIPKEGYRFIHPVEMSDADAGAHVDQPAPDVKEWRHTDKPAANGGNGNGQRLIVEPGVGWEGLVLAVGENSEFQMPEDAPLRFDREFKEMIKKLPPASRAEIFFNFARMAAPKLMGPEQEIWLNWIDGEYWGYCETLDYYGRESARRELEMAADMALYWDIRGRWSEGKERLRRALAPQGDEVSEAKAKALTWYGYFSYHLDDYATAKQYLRDGAAMAKKIGDNLTLALALHALANTHEAMGRYQIAETTYKKSLQASGRAKDAEWLMGRTYRVLGIVAQAQGDPLAAEDYYQKSLAKEEQAKDLKGQATCFNRLCVIAAVKHNAAEARTLLEKSKELEGANPGRHTIALTSFNEGIIEETAGRFDAALVCFRQSYLIRLQLGEKRGTAKAMEASARIGSRIGQEKESAMILGAAGALRASAQAPMSPIEQKRYKDLVTDLRRKHPKEFEEGRRRVIQQDVIPIV